VFDPSDNNIPKSKLGKRSAGYLIQTNPAQRQRIVKNDLLSSPSMSTKSSPEKTPQKDLQGGPSSPLSTPNSTPTKMEPGGCVICFTSISNKSQRLIGCKMKNCENQGKHSEGKGFFENN
jgi:hypothetical protein